MVLTGCKRWPTEESVKYLFRGIHLAVGGAMARNDDDDDDDDVQVVLMMTIMHKTVNDYQYGILI